MNLCFFVRVGVSGAYLVARTGFIVNQILNAFLLSVLLEIEAIQYTPRCLVPECDGVYYELLSHSGIKHLRVCLRNF